MTSITDLLRKILLEEKARTQSEIQDAFKQQGIVASQPKISRLLHQIGAIKLIDHEGKTHYRLPNEAGLIHELTSPQEKTFIRQWILDISSNESLIVIHTTPGAAMVVARMIDLRKKDLNILGTLAGDDTIFIALKNAHLLSETQQAIKNLFDI